MKGADRALALGADPGKFLSSVQIGITLVGVASGAFPARRLGDRLSVFLFSLGAPESVADALGVGLVVAIITYASLIIGELVPKQIALRAPRGDRRPASLGHVHHRHGGRPAVWLLDISGRLVLRLLGQSGQSEEKVTDEEIKLLVAEAEHHGTIESDERA